MAESRPVRIAAVSDIHYGKGSRDHMKSVFEAASASADVLLICGDLTDYGLKEEAELLAADIRTYLRIPALAVLGNHDFESGTPGEVRDVMEAAGVNMLDGECAEVHGVGFAGIHGFGGGFGRYMLNSWGEPIIKAFVQASVDEALKLEQTLTKLQTEQKIVLMHYAPISATVEGEPHEIWPFMGSSRLEEPMNRYSVTACFHGHAHKGAPEGRTGSGIPVFNVAVPVMRALDADAPPLRLFEVAATVSSSVEEIPASP